MQKRYFTTIAGVILAITIGLLSIGCDHEPPPESAPAESQEDTQWPQDSDDDAGSTTPWNQ